MKLTLLIPAAMLLAGCKQQPQRPPREPVTSEALIAQIHREVPGFTNECLDKLKWGGWKAVPNELDRCFKMLPPQRWRGLWRNAFEAPSFCPAPALKCGSDPAAEANQLEMSIEFKSDPPGFGPDTRPGGLYEVEFVGRRTAHGGIHGDHPLAQEIVVDRLISIKEVEGPPKE